MQSQKLVRFDSEGCIGPAIVIAEFHFKNLRTEDLHDGAHLSADQTGLGHIVGQSDNGKKFEISHLPPFYST